MVMVKVMIRHIVLHLHDGLLLRCDVMTIVMIASIVSLGCLNLTIRGHFDPRPVQIISLHAIKSTENEQPLIVKNYSLVESTWSEGNVEGDAPRPRLQLKVVLMNVIESFEG